MDARYVSASLNLRLILVRLAHVLLPRHACRYRLHARLSLVRSIAALGKQVANLKEPLVFHQLNASLCTFATRVLPRRLVSVSQDLANLVSCY